MRALGPGSVSSFLKIILDVAYFITIAILGGGAFLAVIALLAYGFVPEAFQQAATKLRMEGDVTFGQLAVLAAILCGYGIFYLGSLLAILSRLRMVFATLTAGDPFHPENIRRLRLIGFVLAAMELGRYLFNTLLFAVAPDLSWNLDGFNITAWFSVLVVLVLAEVFREGARLRNEAELTI